MAPARDGRETLVKRPKVLKAAHDFSGLDGKTKYRWKGKVMSSDLSVRTFSLLLRAALLKPPHSRSCTN